MKIMRFVLAFTALMAMSACVLTVHQRDEKSIAAAERALLNRRADFGLAHDVIAGKVTATAQVIQALESRNESEEGRLEAHLLYEKSKKNRE